MDNEQMYHHGVIGMKWGVRRYQNKDGSLTAAGRKRLQKLDDEREKLTGEKSNTSTSNSSSSSAKKSIVELSDEELRSRLNRLQMEKQYSDLVKAMTPEKQAKSSKFVKQYLEPAAKKILWDTAVNVGAQAVSQMMANSVNKNSKNIKLNTNGGNQKKEEKKKD